MSSAKRSLDDSAGKKLKKSKKIIKATEEPEVKLPNILVTGTPGVGKSTFSVRAAESTDLKYIDVGKIVKEQKCHTGVDEEFDAFILDEDKLCDYLEPILDQGGCIVDFHTPEIFPERWFELVLVLTSETNVLYDRLESRGYNEAKRNENMECEIMQVVLDAAKDSYDENIVQVMASNTPQDIESNIRRFCLWFQTWKDQNLS